MASLVGRVDVERNLEGPQHIMITKEPTCRRPIDPDIHVCLAAG
jgi:hypothetical protein